MSVPPETSDMRWSQLKQTIHYKSGMKARGGVEFCLRKSTNVWSLVYFFHIRVLFSCVCSLSQFLMYVHKILTIWMWNVHSNGLGTLSCQIQTPGILLGPVMEFTPLFFYLALGFLFVPPLVIILPLVFSFPTLGCYSALGFPTFPILGYYSTLGFPPLPTLG